MPLDKLDELIDIQKKTDDKLNDLLKTLSGIGKPLERLVELQTQAALASEKHLSKLKSLTKAQEDAVDSVKDLASANAKVVDALKDESKAIDASTLALEDNTDVTNENNDSKIKSTELILDGSDALKEEEERIKVSNKLLLQRAKAIGNEQLALKQKIAVLDKQRKYTVKEIEDLKKRKKAAEEERKALGKDFGSLSGAAGNFGGRVKDTFLKETNNELQELEGLLGKNLIGWTAIGAAIVFASSKAKEYLNATQDAAVGFSKFRIDQSALAQNTLVAPGGVKQLEEVRKSLSLSRQEFGAFAKVLQDGVSQGVGTTEKLAKAAGKLREAFGGDQTDRLREYVDLLKEIPTLDQDLKVTADLDDQAAAYFALAQKGKVGTVIELQSAGLLGGIKKEKTPEESNDVKLLNAAQTSAATTEDIKSFLYQKFFPSFGPYVTESLNGIFTLVGGVVGLGATAYTGITLLQKSVSTAESSKELEEEIKEQIEDSNEKLEEANANLEKIEEAIKEEKSKKAIEKSQRRQLEKQAKKNPDANKALKDNKLAARKEALQQKFKNQSARAKALKSSTVNTSVKPTIKPDTGLITKITSLFSKNTKSVTTAVENVAPKTGGILARVLGRGTAVAGVGLVGASGTGAAASGVAETAGTVASGVAGAGGAGIAATVAKSVGIGIVGVAASYLGDKIFEVGDNAEKYADNLTKQGESLKKTTNGVSGSGKILAGSLQKIGGALLKFEGSGISGAGKGAAAGALGGPKGALIGAIVGGTIGKLAGLSDALKGVGEGLSTFGKELNSTTEEGRKQYSALFQAIGYVTEGFGSLLSKIGSFTSGVINTTFKGLKDLGTGALEAAGGLWDYLISSKEGLEAQRKQSAALREAAKLNAIADRATKKFESSLRQVLESQQKSALAMQKLLGFINSASNTGSVQVYEFSEKVATSNLSVLSEIGGSAKEFNSTLLFAADSINKRFDAIGRVLNQAREKLIKDKDLNPENQAIISNRIKQVEIEASAQFVSSMLNLVGQIDKLPEIVQGSLERRLLNLKLELGTSTSSLSAQDIASNLRKQLNSSFSNLQTAFEQGRNEADITSFIGKNIEKRNTSIREQFQEEVSKIDFKSFTGDNAKIAEDLRRAIADNNVSEIERIYKATNNMLEFSKKEDKEKGTSKSVDLVIETIELEKQLESLSKDVSSASKERLEASQKRMAAQDDETEKQDDVNQEKRNKYTSIPSLDTLEGRLFEPRNTTENLLMEEMEKADKEGELKRNLENTQKEKTNLEDRILENLKKQKDKLKATNMEEQMILAGLGDVQKTEAQKKALIRLGVSKLADELNERNKGRTQLGKLNSLASKVYGVTNATNATQQATVRSTEALLGNLQNYLQLIEKISDIAESAAGYKDSQRKLEILETQAPALSLFGESAESSAAIARQNIKSLEELNKGLDETKKTIKEQSDKIKDISGFYNSQFRGLSIDLENMSSIKPDFSGFKKPIKTNDEAVTEILGLSKGTETEIEIKEFYDKIIFEMKKLRDEKEKAVNEIKKATDIPDDVKTDRIAEISKNYRKKFETYTDGLKFIDKAAKELPIDEAKKITPRIKSDIQKVEVGTIGPEEAKKKLQIEIDEYTKKLKEVNARLANAYESLLKPFDNIKNELPIRGFVKKFQASLTSIENAGEKFDISSVEKFTKEAVNASIEASRQERKRIKETTELTMKGLDEQISFLDARIKELSSQSNISEEEKAEIKALETAKKQIDIYGRMELKATAQEALASSELEMKKQVLEAAAKERDITNERLDKEQSLYEETISFLSETGGSVGQIVELQQAVIGLEAQRVEALKVEKARIDAAIEAAETEEAAAALTKESAFKSMEIKKAELQLQRKGIGAQRDAYEKLVANAFGAIRSSVGARKGVTSEAAIFGQNRVQLQSGLIVRGGSQSIEDRQVGLATAAGGSGSTGVLGAPKRNPLEAILQNRMSATTEKDPTKLAQTQADYQKQMVGLLADINKNLDGVPQTDKKTLDTDKKSLEIQKTEAKDIKNATKTTKSKGMESINKVQEGAVSAVSTGVATANKFVSIAQEVKDKGLETSGVITKEGTAGALNRIPAAPELKEEKKNKDVVDEIKESVSINSELLSSVKELVSINSEMLKGIVILSEVQFAKAFTDASGEDVRPALKSIAREATGVEFDDRSYYADPSMNQGPVMNVVRGFTDSVFSSVAQAANPGITTLPDLSSSAAGGGAAQNVKVDVNVEVIFNNDMFEAKVRQIVTKDPAIQTDLERKFVTG